MWIFHPLGFASVVEDEDHPWLLLCRARVKGDLERLFPGCKVKVTPASDYRFRTELLRDEAAARIAELVLEVDYPNFKNACPKDRHLPYLDVWTTMYRLQGQRAPRQAYRPSTLTVSQLDGELAPGMTVESPWGPLGIVAVTPSRRSRGGINRANALTPERRSEIARMGAEARWGRRR